MLFRKLSGDDTLEAIQTEVSTEDGKLHVRRTQDVEPVLDANKRDFNDAPSRFRPDSNLTMVASIPPIVVEQWLKQGINIFDDNDREKILQLLDMPQYRDLRTFPGTLAHRGAKTYITGSGRRSSSAEALQRIEGGLDPGVR